MSAKDSKYAEKSHVSMETHQCVVCGVEYDTGAILLHNRLRPTLEPHTLTGMGMCPEHQKMMDDGYIALVGVEKQCPNPIRTGEVAHIRASVWGDVFNMDPPKNGVALAPPEIFAYLKSLHPGAQS